MTRGSAFSGFRHSRLELLRTRELLQRQHPSPPAVVLDLGGGTGAHAAWLARRATACISSTSSRGMSDASAHLMAIATAL